MKKAWLIPAVLILASASYGQGSTVVGPATINGGGAVLLNGGGTAPPTFVNSTFVAETGAGPFSSIITPAITLSAGQLSVAFYRNGTSAANAFTFSSTPSNTWVALTNQPGGTNIPNSTMGYSFNVGAGSTTFTGTPASSAGFMSAIVGTFSASPNLSTLNTSAGGVQTSGSATVTSSTFTTTQAGLIVFCATASVASSGWTAGTIAGISATIFQVSNTGGIGANADAACEYIVSSGPQTSVTATMVYGTSGRNFTWTVGAFN